MKAYVLVQTDPLTRAVAPELREIPGILFAEDLRGPYDAIALAGSEPGGPPLERVLVDIRKVAGVTKALVAPLIRTSTEVQGGEAA